MAKRQKKMKNRGVQFLAVSFVFGMVSGSVFFWLGLTHNTQSEFYLPTGGLDYSYCIQLFASWFLIGSLVGGGVFVVYRMLLRLFVREGGNA